MPAAVSAAAAAAAALEGDEGPVIRALGHLFRLTEVYLWDEAKIKDDSASEREHGWITVGADTTADGSSIAIDRITEEYSPIEDLELANQMGALGLPISFSTNKEKKSRLDSTGKRRGLLRKCDSIGKVENKTLEFSESVEHENVDSSIIPHHNINFLRHSNHTAGQHEVFTCDFEEEYLGGCISTNGVDDSEGDVLSGVSKDENDNKTYMAQVKSIDHGIITSGIDTITHTGILEHPEVLEFEKLLTNPSDTNRFDDHVESKLCSQQDEKYLDFCSLSYEVTHTDYNIIDAATRQISEGPTNSSPSSALSDLHIHDTLNNIECGEFGVWSVIWDDFYQRNYFYNSETQESTWHPPPGLEYFASSSTSCADKSTVDLVEGHVTSSSANGSTCLEDELSPIERNAHTSMYRNQPSSSVRDLYLASSSVIDMVPVAVKELPEELVQLHTLEEKDHSTGLVDISQDIDEGKNLTSDKTFNIPESSEEVSVSNCLTTKLNEAYYDEYMESHASEINELKSNHKFTVPKMKRRRGRVKKYIEQQGVVGDISANIAKYWCQRYSLFSLYDNGIKMDEEGWFSVTPEAIAKHHASRCGEGIVIDCFTGAGGNAIQFAKRSNHVIAIDIDPKKIGFGQHNAMIYGVHDKIDFVIGDFFQLAAYLKGDTVFLSPPWGGPDYTKVESYDIKTMLKPHDGYHLFKIATMIASKVVMFLPRNVNINQLAELSISLNPPWALEVEKNILNGKCKAITAYFTSPTWEQSSMRSET